MPGFLTVHACTYMYAKHVSAGVHMRMPPNNAAHEIVLSKLVMYALLIYCTV